MQGTRLARIVVDARNRLRVNEIVSLLTPHVAVEAGQGVEPLMRIQFADALLNAHAELNAMMKDPETSGVLQQLGIPRFFDTPTIGKLLGTIETAKDSNSLRSHANFWLFRNFVANLEAFGNLASALQTFLIDQRFRRTAEDEGLVELALLSSDPEPVTLDHLSAVLETVRSLHDLIARTLGEPNSTARVAVIDSGSDVLMALAAKAKTASAIGTLLTQWWDWIKYRELHDLDRKMESISKGLNLISDLDKVAAAGGEEGQQARVLRQSILDALVTLTGLGVKKSEPERTAVDSPLLQAKRDVKLLKQPESLDQGEDQSPGER